MFYICCTSEIKKNKKFGHCYKGISLQCVAHAAHTRINPHIYCITEIFILHTQLMYIKY